MGTYIITNFLVFGGKEEDYINNKATLKCKSNEEIKRFVFLFHQNNSPNFCYEKYGLKLIT